VRAPRTSAPARGCNHFGDASRRRQRKPDLHRLARCERAIANELKATLAHFFETTIQEIAALLGDPRERRVGRARVLAPRRMTAIVLRGRRVGDGVGLRPLMLHAGASSRHALIEVQQASLERCAQLGGVLEAIFGGTRQTARENQAERGRNVAEGLVERASHGR
jgi:hypothetical protein